MPELNRTLQFAFVVFAASFVAIAEIDNASAQITIATVPVGNPGNTADSDGVGEVDYSYNIGKYDVTAGQYTAFLNAVAATDPYGLYNPEMATATSGNFACGITQSGSPGAYSYTTTRNPNYPVNFVSWGDAARFCNWLTNGQPTGPEGNGTTETGSYTLNGAVTDADLNAVARNANADYVIPTLNEWYKAAYYSPASRSYYLYPTSSSAQPSNVLSATGTNNANYYNLGYTDSTNYLTPVGAFADTTSPYGAYDMGGEVYQWDEEIETQQGYGGEFRNLRGGSFDQVYITMESGVSFEAYPTSDLGDNFGIRVSQVPEPTSISIVGVSMMGLLVRRRSERKSTSLSGPTSAHLSL